jgi:hypothetical protein
MTDDSFPMPKLNAVLRDDHGSLAAVLALLQELEREARDGSMEDWESRTVPDVFAAMHSWLSDVCLDDSNIPPSWKLIELLLHAAKKYE